MEEEKNILGNWIVLNRRMQGHWLWTENRKFSKAEAWIDLLMSVNHKPKKVTIKGKVLLCNRGDTLQSLETLSARWKWGRETARRFLKLLEKDGMICYNNETVTSRISVCNYDTYQTAENKVRRKRDASETHPSTNNNDNNENKKSGEDFFFSGIDIRTLDQHRLDGKKRTLAELKHIAKLQSEGITI